MLKATEMLRVDAFQVNNGAILTVKDGDELVIVGIFTVIEISEEVFEIDFGAEFGKYRRCKVHIQAKCFDPVKVGVVESQKRFSWHGYLDES